MVMKNIKRIEKTCKVCWDPVEFMDTFSDFAYFRLKKGKELDKLADIHEYEKNIHLIRAPGARM